MPEIHDSSKEVLVTKAERSDQVKSVVALSFITLAAGAISYRSRHFLSGAARLFRDYPEEAMVANGALISAIAIPMTVRAFSYELPRWRRVSASVVGVLALAGGLTLLSNNEDQTETAPSLTTTTTILEQSLEPKCELVFPVVETDSEQVIRIQASLVNAGRETGPLDGIAGDITKGAINNLAATNGIVLPAGVLIDEATCNLLPDLIDGDSNTPILP